MSENKNNEQSKVESSQKGSPPPTALVWTVRAIAAFTLSALLGYLIYLAAIPQRGPSFDFDVKLSDMRVDDGFMVPITIKNKSTAAISAITVETKFANESYETIIPLLGEGEEATFEIVTAQRPEPGEIKPAVRSYLNF